MGKLRRRFIVCFQHYQGDLTNPLVETRPNQDAMSVVVQTNAALGDQNAGIFMTIAGITRTGDIAGIREGVTVNAGVTNTGETWGLLTTIDILANVITAPLHIIGHRIEINTDPTDTLNGDIYGLQVSNRVNSACAGYHFVRLFENGLATVRSAIYVRVNNAAGCDVTNLFELFNETTAWSIAAMPPGAARGRIAVSVGGAQKYIQLYD